MAVSTKDGAALYKSCAACHGVDASKVALGKSAVIKGWSAQKLADALNGYKAGTYGGAMKGLMAGQVKNLSAEDIKVLSEHIAKF
ncbi:MAG: c-type cytochrome [Sulfurimonas sp.]|nr:c-type cytochrome [Sulfurimonas sp.]MDD3834966.1 c-type cytochrome [Sulfurimonas sp.]